MNIQLLLLLALVGPFCGFTRASPTVLPDSILITETVAHGTVQNALETKATVSPAHSTGLPATAYEVTSLDFVDSTVLDTDTSVTLATTTEPKLFSITSSYVEAGVSTELGKIDVPYSATVAETDGEVVVEENVEEGLGSGQVVGIVIGALVAVVIVIAVVIAVVRRMGKYSP